jgi:hypothetical protein
LLPPQNASRSFCGYLPRFFARIHQRPIHTIGTETANNWHTEEQSSTKLSIFALKPFRRADFVLLPHALNVCCAKSERRSLCLYAYM